MATSVEMPVCSSDPSTKEVPIEATRTPDPTDIGLTPPAVAVGAVGEESC